MKKKKTVKAVKKPVRNVHFLGVNSVGVGYGEWVGMGAMQLQNLKHSVKGKIKESDRDPTAPITEILFLHSKDVQKMIEGLVRVRDSLVKREATVSPMVKRIAGELDVFMDGVSKELKAVKKKGVKNDKKRTQKTQANKR